MNIIFRIKNKVLPDFRRTSYSQCGEDLIVDFVLENYFNIKKPIYLDIGANHPRKINNTYLFYKKSSSGYLVEPDANLFKRLVKARGKRDVCLNIGVGDKEDILKYYRMSIDALNSFSKEEAERNERNGIAKIIEIIDVRVIPINQLLERNQFNFVSIDVEGIDNTIIDNWDFENYRPEVICLETVEFKMNGLGRKKTEMIEKIKSHGYIHYADTYINSIFMKPIDI